MKASNFLKIFKTTTILVFVILTIVCPHRQAPGLVFNQGLPAEVVVEQVIDGDTILLSQGEKVRYLGINAPETMIRIGNEWVQKSQIFGQEAKSFNQRLVTGKKVSLEYDHEKRDDYKRILAYVKIERVFVNGELLRQGLAFLDVRSPNLRYQKLFVDSQKEARSFRRGLWSKIGDYLIPSQDAFHHMGEIGMVQGKISSVRFGRGKLYLNFGENPQEDFTCIIYKENLKNFPLGNISPLKYFLKRKVNVYGAIKNINGPAITVCAPSQMDILH